MRYYSYIISDFFISYNYFCTVLKLLMNKVFWKRRNVANPPLCYKKIIQNTYTTFASVHDVFIFYGGEMVGGKKKKINK